MFSAVPLALVLGVLEVALRLAGLGPMPPAEAHFDPQPTAFGYFAVCDEKLGFRNRARGSYKSDQIEGSPIATTDASGFRQGLGWTSQGESPIVLFVGDSFTFCSEVADDQTGPSEVARRLTAARPVRVLNAGVRGYSTLQAKRMVEECLHRFPAIRVVVYTYYRNDFCENLIPTMQSPAQAPVVVRDAQSGKLREVQVLHPAVPFGASFADAFRPSQSFGWRVRLTSALRTRSALVHRSMIGLRRLADRRRHTFELPDGRTLQIPASLRWDTAGLLYDWARENGGREALQHLLEQMAQSCRARGAAFLTTYATRGQAEEVPYETEYAEVCRAAGVRFESLRDHFTADPDTYAARHLDGQYDHHYGPRGTQAFAAALAPTIQEALHQPTRSSWALPIAGALASTRSAADGRAIPAALSVNP